MHTCIRILIKKSFSKEFSSGIKKEYEENDLLGVLKKMKQRDIPKRAIPSLLGKTNAYRFNNEKGRALWQLMTHIRTVHFFVFFIF